MTRWLSEQREMRDTETELDGTTTETRYFRVSRATYEWLQEHGCLAAISLCDWMDDTIISVAAFVDVDGRWNGWHWIHDELANSGMNPDKYGL